MRYTNLRFTYLLTYLTLWSIRGCALALLETPNPFAKEAKECIDGGRKVLETGEREARSYNSRRRQSSTPAVRQSAGDDRSAVSNGQLWLSVFRCCGPVDLEFGARQSS